MSVPQNPWPAANQLAKAGKLDEAYQELLTHPQPGAVYYYDLGTLASRLGYLGPAVAYLEMADRMQPHDPDIQHNLEIARDTLGRTIGTDHLDPASSWPEQLADHVAMEEIRGALGLVSLILTLYWITSLLKNQDVKRVFLSPSSKLGCLALALVLILYAMERDAENHPAAVSLKRETVRSGPGDSFSELGEVDAGAKVRLLGPRSSGSSPQQEDEDLLAIDGNRPENHAQTQNSQIWLQVRYTSDNVGWIPATDLVVLN